MVQVHHLLLYPCESAEMSVCALPNLVAPPGRTKMTATVVNYYLVLHWDRIPTRPKKYYSCPDMSRCLEIRNMTDST